MDSRRGDNKKVREYKEYLRKQMQNYEESLPFLRPDHQAILRIKIESLQKELAELDGEAMA